MSQKVAPVPIESLARQLDAGRGASCPAVMTVLLQGFPIRSQARHVKNSRYLSGRETVAKEY